MGLFKQIADPLIARNVPVIPLRPKTKIAFLTGWEALASTKPEQIEKWDEEYLDANAACVAYAKPDGVWFFDADRPGIIQRIEEETGKKIPDTLMVRSGPGKGHLYFKQTPASIMLGNSQVTDANGELWSARIDNRYVVAPLSYHPSGHKYELLKDVPIVPAPDWLVQWCADNRKQLITGHKELDEETPIAEGSRNSTLASLLGKARQLLGMDKEQLFIYGQSLNSKRCVPPLSETEVRTIAYSIGRYEVKQTPQLILDSIQPKIELEKLIPYPTFPRWIIKGTSIGDGLVYPTCAVNNSYPEFIFMPAMTLLMNYIGLKIKVREKNIIPNFYMISIGEKGRAFKSSGVQDAIDYLSVAGFVRQGSDAVKNAEGRTLFWSPGSGEGLGLSMSRTNCKNVAVIYDEFKTFTDKVSIEKSSLYGNLSTMYESKPFANSVKSLRESFSHDANSYCASFIACTTDAAFPEQWAQLPKTADMGMLDRFFFLLQPDVFLPIKPYKLVNTVEGSMKTKERVDKAILQGEFAITDETVIENNLSKIGGARGIGLVEKFALYFAIDRGLKVIDETCYERAVELVKYGLAVKKYLRVFESVTKEGAIQQKIIHFLRQHGGAAKEDEMYRVMHPLRFGTYLWNQCYNGLIKNGWISESGDGKDKDNPKQVILLRFPEEE